MKKIAKIREQICKNIKIVPIISLQEKC